MVVSHRAWLGGSLRPLSPTEGKFQLKGNGVLATAGGAISVAECTKIDQGGAFRALATPSSSSAAFFAWQNDYDYGQYILANPCPSAESVAWSIGPEEMRKFKGTAPDDDPV
jgi:hypothetical protein